MYLIFVTILTFPVFWYDSINDALPSPLPEVSDLTDNQILSWWNETSLSLYTIRDDYIEVPSISAHSQVDDFKNLTEMAVHHSNMNDIGTNLTSLQTSDNNIFSDRLKKIERRIAHHTTRIYKTQKQIAKELAFLERKNYHESMRQYKKDYRAELRQRKQNVKSFF